jgi:predicted RNA-binding protein with TRAM domain
LCWRTMKETRALRAEEVPLDVGEEVECGLWEVGAAGEGVV